MATKKSTPKKAARRKTVINKIGGKVGQLAGELAVGKDHLMAMAGDAIASVKSTIKNITVKKKAAVKKTVRFSKKTTKKLPQKKLRHSKKQ
ncbi:MAG: hypothetical protein ABIN89_12820 [Chitinophagaceae bacterium]